MSRASFAAAVAFIYGLTDPETGHIRYIGRSEDPWRRYHEHLSDAAGDEVAQWVRRLSELELSPMLVILRPIVEGEDANTVEQSCIRQLWRAGLLNAAISGTQYQRPRPPIAPGHGLLDQFLKKHGIPLRSAAKSLGASHSAISQWRNGTQRPWPEFRHAIDRWTRGEVPASAWLTPEEEAAVTPFEGAN